MRRIPCPEDLPQHECSEKRGYVGQVVGDGGKSAESATREPGGTECGRAAAQPVRPAMTAAPTAKRVTRFTFQTHTALRCDLSPRGVLPRMARCPVSKCPPRPWRLQSGAMLRPRSPR